MPHQVVEQREFTRPEIERTAGALDFSRQQIERQIADGQAGRFGGPGRSPQQRLQARRATAAVFSRGNVSVCIEKLCR